MQTVFKKILFLLCISLILLLAHFNSLIHQMSAGLAVFSGSVLTWIFSNPFEVLTKKLSSKLLTWSVIGLGFGMNLVTVAKVGFHGVGYTFFGIALCLFLGLLLGKFLGNKRDISVLITVGTAICGGSAIAAIAPTINAKPHEISVALAIIFILNAIALFIFPVIGHCFQLSQHQFGLWSALAIQDTSSVIGASMQYGAQALNIGTTVKLARALWIVPLTVIIGIYYSRYVFKHAISSSDVKPQKPFFILGFLLAAAVVTWLPFLRELGLCIRHIAEQALVVALFFIGCSLSRNAIKTAGTRPFIQGILLWLCTASFSLLVIYCNYIVL